MSENEAKAWYRKYRPSTMEDYMGDDVKKVVEARFRVPENMPQVVLIHGNRGCGKTTFARIVSKYYLCEQPIDGEPCGECDTCRSIDDILIAGVPDVEVPGVTEVDATTANGKEAIQNIVEDAIIPPIYGNKKVVILDEFHMVSPQAQNSLLKIIEDIPAHLVVIFATTNPEKILDTIKSRCQLKLEVKKKSVEELADRLLYIAEKEGLRVEKEALKIIARKEDRVPREAISLLENIAKNTGGEVTVARVREFTGEVAAEIYLNFINAANSSLEDILLFNAKLKEIDMSPKKFIIGLTRFVLDCLYIRYTINNEDYPIEYVEQVKKVFKHYTSSNFDTLLQCIEYASKMVGEDETRGELVITTTALRIGKIGLFDTDLSNESKQAEIENKQSIKEYKKIAENEIEEQMNNTHSISPTKEKLISLLGGMTDVANSSNISIDVDSDKSREEKEEGFFSAEDLESLLD